MPFFSLFFGQLSIDGTPDIIDGANPVLSSTQMYIYGAFILICLVVVMMFWKKTAFGSIKMNKNQKLKVSEMRMLGNKQYLAVVEYEDSKILLGISPGLIQHLGHLDASGRKTPESSELEKILSVKSEPITPSVCSS
jgi:flagellar biogenesis protein FliO